MDVEVISVSSSAKVSLDSWITYPSRGGLAEEMPAGMTYLSLYKRSSRLLESGCLTMNDLGVAEPSPVVPTPIGPAM